MYRALLNRLDVDSDEYLSHEGIILHNIGIVYTLDDQYYRAIDKFKEAAKSRENCLDSFEMDYIVSALFFLDEIFMFWEFRHLHLYCI